MVKHLCDVCGKELFDDTAMMKIANNVNIQYNGAFYEFCSIKCGITFLTDEMNKQKGEVK